MALPHRGGSDVAGTVGEDFARIVALAHAKLEEVEVSQEIDLDRAILTI